MGDACGKGKYKFYRDLRLPFSILCLTNCAQYAIATFAGFKFNKYDFTLFMNNHQLAVKDSCFCVLDVN